MADEQGVLPWEVLTGVSMRELVHVLPTNNLQLLSIKGIGKGKQKRYGEALLIIIENYTREHQVTPNLLSGVSANALASDTKFISLQLFESGKTIEEISSPTSPTSLSRIFLRCSRVGLRDGLVLDASLRLWKTRKSNVVRIRVVLEPLFFAVSLANYVYSSTVQNRRRRTSSVLGSC